MVSKTRFTLMRLHYSLQHPIIAIRTIWNWGTLPIPRLLPPPPDPRGQPAPATRSHHLIIGEIAQVLSQLRRAFYADLDRVETAFHQHDFEATELWLEQAGFHLQDYRRSLPKQS
ncbi:MAG: hypothetical protein JRJ69_10325 [Deltaproteobacteria bacterium]|nr:hypothetical protein [Deltaproteobacteria bacterium]